MINERQMSAVRKHFWELFWSQVELVIEYKKQLRFQPFSQALKVSTDLLSGGQSRALFYKSAARKTLWTRAQTPLFSRVFWSQAEFVIE